MTKERLDYLKKTKAFGLEELDTILDLALSYLEFKERAKKITGDDLDYHIDDRREDACSLAWDLSK